MPQPILTLMEQPSEPPLLARLRGAGGARPKVDAALAGGLRAWLEDVVAPLPAGDGATRPGGTIWVVDRRALSEGASRPMRPAGASHRWSPAALHLAMVRALFRQAVTVGALHRPFDSAVAALSVGEHGPQVVRALESLDSRHLAKLRAEVRSDAQRIASDWQPVPRRWLPRTGERMTIPLAGGRVLLAATADLALGAPACDLASVCLLDVQVGPPVPVHHRGRRLLALAETLRSGAAPFRVATYYSATGELHVHDVTEDDLAAAVGDVGWAVPRARLDTSPNPRAA